MPSKRIGTPASPSFLTFHLAQKSSTGCNYRLRAGVLLFPRKKAKERLIAGHLSVKVYTHVESNDIGGKPDSFYGIVIDRSTL